MTKVTPGQPVSISALEHNTTLDVNDAWRSGRLQPRRGESSGSTGHDGLLVKNDTGSDRDRFGALGVGTPTFLPTDNLNEYLKRVVLSGQLPTLSHLGRFAVLLEPLAAGKVGRAAYGGTLPMTLQVDSIHHDRADIANGSAVLTSNYYGAAEILWQEPGTGLVRATVRISGWAAPPVKAVATETIEPGEAGTVRVWRGGVDTGDEVQAWLNWMTGGVEIGADTELEIEFKRDELKWWIRGAACQPSYLPGSDS